MTYKELDELYGVSKEFVEDDCEYEVTKKAMLSYLKYPCYEKWIPFLYGGTRENYLNYDRVLKNGYRGDKDYRGAYLLRNNENTQVLTADILTSIKYPSKTCFPGIQKVFKEKEELNKKWSDVTGADKEKEEKKRKWGDVTGAEIKEKILNGQLDDKIVKLDDELLPYFKAFAYVYYWCGNMMPVPSNVNSGTNGGDHWHNKIEHIKKCFEEEYNDPNPKDWKYKWNEWIKVIKQEEKYKEKYNVFISDYFLEDCFENGTDLKNMNKRNSLISSSNKKEKIDWLINNTKFIIQRSYRIQNVFHGEWDDKEKVQQIFKIVFETADLNTENDQELLELF